MSQKSESVDIQDLQDIRTPFGVPLSGIYQRSFAYITIKDRLPIILTKVIDTLSRSKESIAEKYGENALEDVKQITGFISKLKNEIVTNKTLKRLRLSPEKDNDAEEWNKYLIKRTEIEGHTPTWFNTIWLYCECYMYRALMQEIALTNHLYSYDPFEQQKQATFISSLSGIEILSTYVMNLTRQTEDLSVGKTKEELIKVIKLNLWSNKCDLSLSAGTAVTQTDNPLKILKQLDSEILADHSEFIWNLLRKKETNDADVVDVILDNAGYEFFTDLCLAVFLIAYKFAKKIRIYVKRYPWYVSDATRNDVQWTLNYMSNSSHENLREMGELGIKYLKDNVWTIEEENYWTGPYDYANMREQNPTLYAKLSEAKLAIFKGDLNYRKLVGDINWKYTTEFFDALRGFRPTHVLSLRTIKSDACAGLPPGVAERLFEKDENWMFTGDYGLIQTTLAVSCQCSTEIC